MSKPNKPGELRSVTVNAISLVSKAANGKRYKFFKSADAEDRPTEDNTAREGLQKNTASEEVKKDERGLFRTLKEFFTGTAETVEKGAVEDALNAEKAGSRLYDAFNALMKVLGLSRWDDERLKPETDTVKIVSAVDDFRNVAIEILLGKSEIEKSGRKISGSRLSKLKNVQALLNEILSDVDNDDDTSKEAEEVTKEEVQKMVEDAVKAVNDGQKASEEQKTVEAPEKTASVEDVVKNALAPILERIEKIENARGFSNRVPEDTTVEKSANDFWGGIF